MNENEDKVYDLIIIGGGPAGAASSVYAARKQLNTMLIVHEWGGQSQVSETIYNWIGTKEISGAKLATDLKEHALSYKGEYLNAVEGVKASNIIKDGDNFIVTTDDNKIYKSKSVLICSGSSRRKLPVENADKYEHKGITYCASCDGPVFVGQDVIVIGGGNAGFESALQLAAYCKTVTMVNRGDSFRADPITIEKTLAKENIKSILNADILRVDGEMFVNSLTYKDKITNEEITIPTGGIFVEIGQIPNTDFVKELLPLSESNNIIVDPTNQRTKIAGIWAAGDVTDGLYHQNNIAAGDAVKAIEDIYICLQKM